MGSHSVTPSMMPNSMALIISSKIKISLFIIILSYFTTNIKNSYSFLKVLLTDFWKRRIIHLMRSYHTNPFEEYVVDDEPIIPCW